MCLLATFTVVLTQVLRKLGPGRKNLFYLMHDENGVLSQNNYFGYAQDTGVYMILRILLHPLAEYGGCSCTHCTHGSYAYAM